MERGRRLDQALVGERRAAAAAGRAAAARRSVDAAVNRWSRRGAVCYCSGGYKSRPMRPSGQRQGTITPCGQAPRNLVHLN
jgi:hypothetical protein